MKSNAKPITLPPETLMLIAIWLLATDPEYRERVEREKNELNKLKK